MDGCQVQRNRWWRSPRVLSILCLLSAAVFRSGVAATPQLHDWDERYHALVAKHLAAAPLAPVLLEGAPNIGGEGWTGTRVFLHKPPLALWTMALGYRLFGPVEWSFRVVSVILSIATVAVVLWFGWTLGGPWLGVAAAFLMAVSPELLGLVSGARPADQVDAQLVFWVTLSAAGLWRLAETPRWSSAAVAALALSGGLLTKSWPALAAVPAALSVSKTPRVAATIVGVSAIGVAAAAPWTFFAAHRWPDVYAGETLYTLRHLTEVLEGHSGGVDYFVLLLLRWTGPLALVALVVGAWRATRRSNRVARFLAVWCLVPLLVFTAARTKMDGYIAPELPPLALLTAQLWLDLLAVAGRGRGLARGLAGLIPLWAVCALALALRGLVSVPDSYTRFRAVAFHLSRGDRVFNLRWAVQAMVYSDVFATERWPERGELVGRGRGGTDFVASCEATPPVPEGTRPLPLDGLACIR